MFTFIGRIGHCNITRLTGARSIPLRGQTTGFCAEAGSAALSMNVRRSHENEMR
jgi:hypothetical protein